jgi:GT2 family glycosyltransferase
MSIAVVILNWNGRHFLEQFLPTIIKYSASAEVIVADNGSTDDSIFFLEKNFPSIKIIPFKENLGFTGGYNAALKQVHTDYYVLLNSDVEVTANWIEPVVEMMEKNKTIGAAQPKMISYYQREMFEYAGAAGGFIDKYGYPFCRGRLFLSVEKDTNQYDDEKKIFWATGACMFVRASAFHKVKGFDEHFFAHMEEIDLCWRMQAAGYEIRYCPRSMVYHVGAGTLLKSNPRKTYLNFRNNLLMLYKNLDAASFRKVYSFRFLFDMLAAFRFLFGKSGSKEMTAVIRAHLHFHQLKNKVDKNQNPLTSAFVANIYPKSILLDYFIGGKKTFLSLLFGY